MFFKIVCCKFQQQKKGFGLKKKKKKEPLVHEKNNLYNIILLLWTGQKLIKIKIQPSMQAAGILLLLSGLISESLFT